ncbi:MAG: ABC transporter ATP-binding protein [Clostridiales bacterium]|nr:ABC transporter ATP-binding protein [Clostridiales bacterium]
MTSSIKLSVSGVTKRYDGKTVIEDVSFELRDGEIISIVGESGVGKTTLFNVAAGLTAPDEGSITLNGCDITGVAGHVGYMSQKDLLLPYKTVMDNVTLPLVISGERKRSARERAAKMFKKFGLSGYENAYPKSLSGGMRQRAALLRTFFLSRDITLLDEPFSALDAITKTEMRSWYVDMAEEFGLSTLLITHDIDEAINLSDRVIILKGSPGRIYFDMEIRGKYTEFALSNDFLRYKRDIIEALN